MTITQKITAVSNVISTALAVAILASPKASREQKQQAKIALGCTAAALVLDYLKHRSAKAKLQAALDRFDEVEAMEVVKGAVDRFDAEAVVKESFAEIFAVDPKETPFAGMVEKVVPIRPDAIS